MSARPNRSAFPLMRLVLVAALGVGALSPAEARERKAAPASIAVDYGIALAGLPIGTARLAGTFESAKYRVDVSATLTGLVGAIDRRPGLGPLGRDHRRRAAAQHLLDRDADRQFRIAVRMALAHGNVTRPR